MMHLLLLRGMGILQLQRRVMHLMHVQQVRRVRAVSGRHCSVRWLRLERESGNGRQHEARGNSKRRADQLLWVQHVLRRLPRLIRDIRMLLLLLLLLLLLKQGMLLRVKMLRTNLLMHMLLMMMMLLLLLACCRQ